MHQDGHFRSKSDRFCNSAVSLGGVGRHVDRVHDGVLGPAPYKALVPHGIAGWSPELSQSSAQRVKAAGDRMAGLGARLPKHPALEWCLNRSEGIATSDVEGVSTTLRSLSLLESLRAERDPGRQKRDRQALGAVRLAAHAVAVGRRALAPVRVSDLSEMHRRLFEGADVPFEPGSVRGDDIWVGPRGATPPEAPFVAPISAAIAERKQDYFAALRPYQA